jgi:hypothetical protein
MMKKIISILFILVIAAAFSGCIGGGGAVTASSAPAVLNSFTSAMSQLPRGNRASTLPSLGGGGGVTVSSISTRVAPSCYDVSASVDGDIDGIALLKIYTFNCNNNSDGAFIYNQTGTFKVIDKDDAVAGIKGGYRFEFNMPKWFFKDVSTGFTGGGSHKGFWEGSGTDTSSHFTSDYTGRNYYEGNYASLGNFSTDYTFSHKFDLIYTHNSTAAGVNWSAGTMNGKGTFSWSGTFVTESLGGDHKLKSGDATMTWQAIDVTFDSVACPANWYKSGKIIFTDGGGNKMEQVYGCTVAPKNYLNGKLI